MLKTTMIAACVLGLSGSVALAQNNAQYNSSGGILPPGGATAAPYDANGSAPMRDVGSPTANATDTANGGTQSTTMLHQKIKNESAAGYNRSYGQAPLGSTAGYARTTNEYRYGPQQAYGAMDSSQNPNPNAVCITDEYGYKYNCRGDRIGGPRR